MNSLALRYFFRFIFLLLLQVLIFKRLDEAGGIFEYGKVIIHPLFVILLPLRLPMVLLLIIAFFTGLSVDAFYDSPGVHAGALVFMAFLRPLALNLLQPHDGYNVNHNPTKHHLGIGWFLSYSSILMGVFLLAYFSLEVFTWVYLPRILLRALVSFLLSMIFITAYQYLFNPKE